MRIQDLNTQIQRLEAKNQQDILEQKLFLEKEHLVNIIFTNLIQQIISLSNRIKSTN